MNDEEEGGGEKYRCEENRKEVVIGRCSRKRDGGGEGRGREIQGRYSEGQSI